MDKAAWVEAAAEAKEEVGQAEVAMAEVAEEAMAEVEEEATAEVAEEVTVVVVEV